MRRFPEIALGFLLGFATLLVVFLLSSDIAAHYEICENTKEGAKECASYNVLSYAMHKVGAAFDTLNGVITAIATAFIAWFTLSLRQSTDKLWDAGERQLKLLTDNSAAQSRDMQASLRIAQQSAIAAEASARAAIFIEMPVITASPEHLSWGTSQDAENNKINHVSLAHISFYNHGRTDAYLAEIKCGWFVGNELPPRPNYQFTELINTDRIFKKETGGDVRVSQFEFAIEPDLFDKLRRREMRLWCFCELVYSDFMQIPHRACFCWERWQSPGAGGFNVDTTEAYNHRT